MGFRENVAKDALLSPFGKISKIQWLHGNLSFAKFCRQRWRKKIGSSDGVGVGDHDQDGAGILQVRQGVGHDSGTAGPGG
jgi:hypothetical protein